MQKVKLKLNCNEYKAVFDSMKMINVDMFSSSLQTKAQQFILQGLYMRMAQKMFNLGKDNSITLSLPEAWAFFEKMPSVMQSIGPYEQLAVQKVINNIHQQTI